MEENQITSREELKSYFEAGDYPTQGQFGKLIDSLRHKEDVLTNKEAAILTNSLNGYIEYITNTGDVKFPIVINSSDQEDQIINVNSRYDYEEEKKYFFGNAPYNIKAKEFPVEGLEGTQYYLLRYKVHPNYTIERLFGNNLPTIPDGFEFGILKSKKFYLRIEKQDYGKQINIVNTNIKFVNKTEIPIQYRVQSGNWGDTYKSSDTVTNHYDEWDHLNFYYNADFQEDNKFIECKIYNADNNELLSTSYLSVEYNSENAWPGSANRVRNIRIECDYTTYKPNGSEGAA